MAPARSTRPACARCSVRSIAATRYGSSKRWRRGMAPPRRRDRPAPRARTFGRRHARGDGRAAAADGGAPGRPEAVDADDPDAAAQVRLSTLLAPDETQLLYSIVLHGRAEIALAPDEYSGLVMVLLRLLAFPSTSRRESRHRRRLRAAPRAAAAARPAVSAAAVSSPIRRDIARPVSPIEIANRRRAGERRSNEQGAAPTQAASSIRPGSGRPRAADDGRSVGSEPPPWIDAPEPRRISGREPAGRRRVAPPPIAARRRSGSTRSALATAGPRRCAA